MKTTDAAEKQSIIAIGDSITEGGRHFHCYREYLIPLLEEKQVIFVGPKQDQYSPHAGYSGKNTTYLKNKINEIYSANPADIVLLHAGHNNFAKDKPIPRVIDDTREILRSIKMINPKAVILLAQVIPSGKLPKYEYIPELNRKLERLAKELKEDGYKIVIVDHATHFEWQRDTVSDKVHPNAQGAKKMANCWIQALLPILE